MANKYASNAKAILLNNGTEQLLPVSKAKLIELAKSQQGQFGKDVVDVEGALSYLLGQDETNLTAAKTYTGTSIEALDSTIKADNGYVLTSITEVDGKLTSYTQTRLDASVVTYNGGEDVNNVGTALTDIYGKLAAISGTGTGSIKDQINAAIQELDVNEIKEDGKAIVSVSETDGKIAATAGNIKAQCVDVDNTTLHWDTNGDNTAESELTVQSAIAYLDSQITALEIGAARYTIEQNLTNLPANVKEQYVLKQTVNGNTTSVNVPINIYKDSQLLAAKISTADATYSDGNIVDGTGASALVLVYSVYKNDSWTEEVVPIPVANFFSSLTAGNGLTENNGVLNVVKGANSENFLTVNNDSIEITGVQNAINIVEQNAKTHANGLINDVDAEVVADNSGTSYVLTGVKLEGDNNTLEFTSYTGVALTDANVKTTGFTGEDLATLLGTDIQNVTNVHDALNKIAGKVNNTSAGAVNNIIITDGTYVKSLNASKDNNNTYSFTIDDSALGNAATLSYTVLNESIESVTIFSANPEI